MSMVGEDENSIERISMERRNLSQVCRFAVKSLIDKSCFETIDESHTEFLNFCAILENLLNHRIKNGNSGSWISKKSEPPCFWLLMRNVCRRLHHNCITSIESMEHLSSAREKGRAWIRLALMEKKLSDYVSVAIVSADVIRKFYLDGAFLLSEDTQKLVLDLLGLNAIDFSFDLKEVNLSSKSTPLIDYTPYLTFQQCQQSLESDGAEYIASLEPSNGESIELEKIRSWKDRYDKLEKKYKAELEQKGYLEELVRLRDSQLLESNQQRQALLINLENLEREAQSERRQLESVVLELQSQLTMLKEEHLRLTRQIRAYIQATDQRRRHNSDSPEYTVDTDMQSMASSDLQVLAPDTRSILSNSSSMSPQPPDSQSLVPLAGSLTSLTTDRTSETKATESQSMIRQLVIGKKIAMHDIPLGVEANESSFKIDTEANTLPTDDEASCSADVELFDLQEKNSDICTERPTANGEDIYEEFDFNDADSDDDEEKDLLVGSQCTLDSESSIALVHRNYNINPGIDVDDEHRSMTPTIDDPDSKETTPIVNNDAPSFEQADAKDDGLQDGKVNVFDDVNLEEEAEEKYATENGNGAESLVNDAEGGGVSEDTVHYKIESTGIHVNGIQEENDILIKGEKEKELNEMGLSKSMSIDEINDENDQILADDDVESSDDNREFQELNDELENSNQSNSDFIVVDNRPSMTASTISTGQEQTNTANIVDNMNSVNLTSTSHVEQRLIDESV
ncbi:uncharacterized protein LOC141907184 [Tubulanus polymorphus]|uniref:uncharacterized protein LOC141907184 n=1 Tax=Tubulanus polymorphus TaxID=672921 RepID=UPI003DA2161A